MARVLGSWSCRLTVWQVCSHAKQYHLVALQHWEEEEEEGEGGGGGGGGEEEEEEEEEGGEEEGRRRRSGRKGGGEGEGRRKREKDEAKHWHVKLWICILHFC